MRQAFGPKRRPPVVSVRYWYALVAAILVAVGSPLSASALGSNTATKLPDGRWEQVFFNGKIHVAYDPKDFIAGGTPAVLKVENREPGKISINSEKSRFLGEGLKEENIAFDPALSQFTVSIPEKIQSREFEYVVAFDCQGEYKDFCSARSLFLPVFDDRQPVLKTEVKDAVIRVSIWNQTSELAVELTANSAYYDARNIYILKQQRHEDLFGLCALDFLQLDQTGNLAVVPAVERVRAGVNVPVTIRLRHCGFWPLMTKYVAWDLTSKPQGVPIRYVYEDQYGRRWRPIDGEFNMEYSLPWLLQLVYYVVVLLVGAIAGNLVRGVLGRFTPIRSEVWVGFHSWLLAGAVSLAVLLLGLKFEPAGTSIQLGLRSTTGLATTGFICGLMPDEIKAMMQRRLDQVRGRKPTQGSESEGGTA